MNLIGKKIKIQQHESVNEMYVGKIGTIVYISSKQKYALVEFDDESVIAYPFNLIEL